jgi:hypothetical protein
MTGNEVRELSNVTRNYEQLVSCSPALRQASPPINASSASATRSALPTRSTSPSTATDHTQNNWTIDGADNVDRGANLTLLAYPTIDTIAEFNVLRSSYVPEHGRSSAGEITVITRSGTSAFHSPISCE